MQKANPERLLEKIHGDGRRECRNFDNPKTKDLIMPETFQGTVKWFNAQKGYGFITPDAGGRDVFLHITALKDARIDNLDEGDRISYTLQNQKGKESATDIQLLK